MCPACLKPIVYQKTYLIAACGHVTCEACTRRFVVPDKKCFECAVEVRSKKDIVALQQAGSSYVAGKGTVAEVSKWAPSLLV